MIAAADGAVWAHASHGATGTVLITGGYGGIGLPCARTLAAARPDWVVIVAGRDIAAARQATRLIGGRAVPWRLELGSLVDVQRGCDQLAEAVAAGRLPPLTRLICNAGQQAGPTELAFSEDGIEQTFAVNHLGHFALVTRLLATLAPRARIIVVSSATHDPATLEGRFNPPRFVTPEELARPRRSGPSSLSSIRRYASSKLCNLLFAYELSRRLPELRPGIAADVFAFDPGAVPTTGLLRRMPGWMKVAIAWPPMLKLLRVRVATPESAGASLARLALDEALIGTGPAYFSGDLRKRSSKQSYGHAEAAALWSFSEQQVARLASSSDR